MATRILIRIFLLFSAFSVPAVRVRFGSLYGREFRCAISGFVTRASSYGHLIVRQVEPDQWFDAQTADEHVQVAVAIEVAERGFGGIVAFQAQAAVGEVTAAIVEPNFVGLAHIGDENIQITVQVEVTNGQIGTHGRVEGLTAVGELTRSVVQEEAAGETAHVAEAIRHQRVEVAVTVEVGQSDASDGGLVVIQLPAGE